MATEVVQNMSAHLLALFVGSKVKTVTVEDIAKLVFADQWSDRGLRRALRNVTTRRLPEIVRYLRDEHDLPVYTFTLTPGRDNGKNKPPSPDTTKYRQRPITDPIIARGGIPYARRAANAIRYSPMESGDVYPDEQRKYLDETGARQLNTRNGLPEGRDPRATAGGYLVAAVLEELEAPEARRELEG